MKDLEKLIGASKEKLNKQRNEDGVSNTEDLYAEFRDDAVPTSVKATTEIDYSLGGNVYDEDDEQMKIDYSLADAAERAYPDGPPIAQVAIWKKKFGQTSVFHVRILEREFTFRTLSRMEYKKLISLPNLDSIIREEIICKECTLWPEVYDFRVMASDDAGYPGSLSQIIMENSGFTNNYEIEIL